MGVDRHDLTGALDAFTGGVERRIDTAEVNGRMFLNNVSLGIYGDAVRSPAYRRACAFPATLRTAISSGHLRREALSPSHCSRSPHGAGEGVSSARGLFRSW